MKQKSNTFLSRVRKIALLLLSGAGIIVLLEGCGCESYCGIWYSVLRLERKREDVNYSSCTDHCLQDGQSYSSLPKKDSTNTPPVRQSSLNSTKSDPPVDSPMVVGNPIPQKKEPGQIVDPKTGTKKINSDILPGEYFATTIFAGPNLSFLNGGGEYGDYYKPQSGVGFEVGIGNAFPIDRHWGLTSDFRFKQCNTGQKIEYSGGGYEGYEDKYTYNYLAGTILAEYYVGRHLSIVAGPELNFLVSATMKPGSGGDKEKIKDKSTSVGFDMQAGLKYEIPAGNRRSKWGLHLMYDHRFTRINQKEDNGAEVPAYHLKTVRLGLSYFIRRCCKAPKQKPS